MYCPHCGKQISEKDTFCRFCGGKIEDLFHTSPPPSSIKPDIPRQFDDLDRQFILADKKTDNIPKSSPSASHKLHSTQKEKRKSKSRLSIILEALLCCIIVIAVLGLVALGILKLVNPDWSAWESVSEVLSLQTATPKPTKTPKPTVKITATPRPTPSPTPLPKYHLNCSRYEASLTKRVTYNDFVSEYNRCIEWRINQYSAIQFNMNLTYNPDSYAVLNESYEPTTTVRNQINETSAINIEYTKNNEYLYSVVYLSNLKLTDTTFNKATYPMYSLLNALRNIGLCDYDDVMDNLKIDNIKYAGESAKYDTDTMHFEFYYLDSGELRFEATIKTTSE